METNLTPMARTKATTEAKSKKAKAGSGTKRKTAATKVKEGVAAETAAGEPVVKRGRARPCKVQPVSAPVPESNAIGAAEGSGTSKEISDGYEKPQPEPETAPAPKSVEEKRRARFRPKCPVSITQRKDRAVSQRMFLIDRTDLVPGQHLSLFCVAGSTGNVYSVSIGPAITCDCPDYNNGNSPCKHIIFVFLKVLKVPLSSTFWYQKALLTSELKEVFDNAPAVATGVTISAAAHKAMQIATGAAEADDEPQAPESEKNDVGKRLDAIGEDCPICFDEMTQAEHAGTLLVFDMSPGGCHRPLHAECFRIWAETASSRGTGVTCVYCRSNWVAAGKPNASASITTTADGYLNMADVLGMSRRRDTSSYYHGPSRGERFRGVWYDRYQEE